MAKRKIVFIIVEGPSDDDSLGLFLMSFMMNLMWKLK